jgi:hypothetical protein
LQISEDLFEEIQDILADEDPRDHES